MRIKAKYPTAGSHMPCNAPGCRTDIAPGERHATLRIHSDAGTTGLRRYCRRCWPERTRMLGVLLGATDLLDVQEVVRSITGAQAANGS